MCNDSALTNVAERTKRPGECWTVVTIHGLTAWQMTLEMDVKDVAGIVIEGMKGHAEELGLTGTE